MKKASTEDAFLSSFDIGSILPKSVEILAEPLIDDAPVILKVSDKAGRSYVIRRTMSVIVKNENINDKVSNVPFEHFSNLFAKEIPGVHVPALRVLSERDSQALMSRLDIEGMIVDEPHRQIHFDNTQVSITPFYDAELGIDYLERIGISSDLRKLIIQFQHRLLPESAQHAREKLVRAWNYATPAQSKAIREDLSILLPTLRGVPESRFSSALTQHLAEIMNEKVALGLTVRAWYRTPEKVRTQLANHWAVYAALGIDDFHEYNWLIKNESVIGIDLAQRTELFDLGSAQIDYSFAGLPSDQRRGNEVLMRLFQANISPETRNYLSSLTRDQIRNVAARAGFSITDQQIQGILTRIAAICKRQ